MADEFLTVAEVAELLKVNPQTVRNWIDRGELPAVRVGSRRVRVRQSDLDAYIDAGATIAPEPEFEPGIQVDEGSVTAWATFGAALTETSARLESPERDQLLKTLDALVVATVLRASLSMFSGSLRASRSAVLRSAAVGDITVFSEVRPTTAGPNAFQQLYVSRERARPSPGTGSSASDLRTHRTNAR